MKLIFKQRFFSLLDSYDVYDENGKTVYVIDGRFSIGHCFAVLSPSYNKELAVVKQKVLALSPTFNIYVNNRFEGSVRRRITCLNPVYDMNFKGWRVDGNIFGFDYSVFDEAGECVAQLKKEILNLRDTYIIDVFDDKNALYVLVIAIALDAEKCQRGIKVGIEI